jgi:Asp-tRNA(Asn)/Glu-tRNA(Gln) amidotransferase A subunit family amidase
MVLGNILLVFSNFPCSTNIDDCLSNICVMVRLIAVFSFFALVSCQSYKDFSKKDVRKAQKLIGLEFEEEKIDTMYGYLQRNKAGFDSLRKYDLNYQTFPALLFDPHPRGFVMPTGEEKSSFVLPEKVEMPDNKEEIAFFTIPQLAQLLRQKDVTSVELTKIYLNRLKEHNPTLQCAITITEELALAQAAKADQEIAAGKFRSLIHGIPYGVKDLLAVDGYPTTWGAMPYKDQQLNHTATVVKKLEEAGGILVAKLTSGALARGDVWFGGKTLNPWDLKQGASGSSAGSGSATSAGLVGFSIGTETLGSITSPSTRNGISGLRPTYGRVSRAGVMSLSWSMDKVGPMCRSAEDCAIVMSVIEGSDKGDQTAVDAPFGFKPKKDWSSLRIGILQSLVDKDTSKRGENLKEAIQMIKSKGIKMVEVELPTDFPFAGFDVILRAEAGAFFEELVRSGEVDIMVQQGPRSRANSLRQARFIPAVEYLQANRHRQVLIEEVHQVMKDIDILITPTFGGSQLMTTNLTGHPVVCIPTGLDDKGHPTSISFLGNLYDDDLILAFAKWFQDWTEFDEMHPPLFFPKG